MWGQVVVAGFAVCEVAEGGLKGEHLCLKLDAGDVVQGGPHLVHEALQLLEGAGDATL